MTLHKIPGSIAIIDLDGEGMIIDSSARDQEAHRRVQTKIQTMQEPPAPHSNGYWSLFYSTDAFYDPHLLSLDQLNPGADLALARLEELYEDVYILTARPDFLATPTQTWLNAHGIRFPSEDIRYKICANGTDQHEQRVSTAAWKTIIVHQAATWYQRVLFVDDDPRNRQAVKARNLANVLIQDSLADYCFDDSPIFL